LIRGIDSTKRNESGGAKFQDSVRILAGRYRHLTGKAAFSLALQLHFLEVSESMGNHDSKIVDAGRVD
jgi:hypothetical protein